MKSFSLNLERILSLQRLKRFLSGRPGLIMPRRLSLNDPMPASVFPVEASETNPSEPATLSTPPTREQAPPRPVPRLLTLTPERPTPVVGLFRSLMSQIPTGFAPPAPVEAASLEQQSVVTNIERADPPRPLPAGTQQFLGGRLGLWLPRVLIHTGPAADRLARLHQADAVSFADRIAFRHQRYQPETPAGQALLGHELTHISQAWQADRSGMDRPAPRVEEQSALINERRILAQTPQTPPVPEATTAPVPMASPASAAGPIRAAREDRDQGETPRQAGLTPRDMARIKDEVYRDLKDRFRTEYERGN